MSAYYNENDLQKCAWLKELIRQKVIAPGEVDERSIAEVQPDDIRRFAQCHFFAGIGVWSYSLRLAGWPDTRPVWTGSCPCPSFSCAGKGAGFNDPRHLWPHWDRLIQECLPPVLFGEQVDDAVGHGWFDLVHVALESAAYSVGAAILGACSVGAPHIRQRLYFVAKRDDPQGGTKHGTVFPSERETIPEFVGGSDPVSSAHDDRGGHPQSQLHGERGARNREEQPQGDCSPVSGANTMRERGQQDGGSAPGDEATDGREGRNGSRKEGDYQPAGDGKTRSRSQSLHTQRRTLDLDGQDGRDGPDDGRAQAHSEPRAHGEVRSRTNAASPRQAGAEDGGATGSAEGEGARSGEPERNRAALKRNQSAVGGRGSRRRGASLSRQKSRGQAERPSDAGDRGHTEIDGCEGQSLRSDRESPIGTQEAGLSGGRGDTQKRGQPVRRSSPRSNGHAALTGGTGISLESHRAGPSPEQADGPESGAARASGRAGDGGNAAERGSGTLDGQSGARAEEQGAAGGSGVPVSDRDSDREGLEGHWRLVPEQREEGWQDETGRSAAPGPTGGFWSGCEWWYGRDGKWRPIEPGIFPLAYRTPNRVVKLRGYGDAIVAPLAAQFIAAASEAIDEWRRKEAVKGTGG